MRQRWFVSPFRFSLSRRGFGKIVLFFSSVRLWISHNEVSNFCSFLSGFFSFIACQTVSNEYPTNCSQFSTLLLCFRISLCHYSGYKIYPGKGKTMVRTDGRVSSVIFYWFPCFRTINWQVNFKSFLQTYQFLDSKCERAHLMKRNPRNTTWTVLYR